MMKNVFLFGSCLVKVFSGIEQLFSQKNVPSARFPN